MWAMTSGYPILLSLAGRQCIIVGGGAVAARKARGLLRAGADHVRMIAPQFAADVPDGVQRIQRVYQHTDIDGAFVVFAATDSSDVNSSVVSDCARRGILVSRADADEADSGDFVSMAQLIRGPVQVAVASGGAALSVKIRDRLAESWDDRWTAAAVAMVELRDEFKQRFDEPTRRNLFREMSSDEAMDVAASEGTAGVRRWIESRVAVAEGRAS
jgi:precorrin-2 dehydrogenase/sirohydrochlorin ferrochelatase